VNQAPLFWKSHPPCIPGIDIFLYPAGISNKVPESPQGISVFIVPGLVIEMTPAHVHMHLLILFSAGLLAIITVGEPGAQGAAAGTHGTGVGTPRAADVAKIKAGFVGALHMPKWGIFTTGLWSMMFAAG
jgi:putative effector of murein hydrolase